MLYHSHTLSLLSKFKQTNEEPLLKEIISLLIDSQPYVDIKDILVIIFSNMKIKRSKKQNLQLLTEFIKTYFRKSEDDKGHTIHILNDYEGVTQKGVQLIMKKRRQILKTGNLKKTNEDKIIVETLMSMETLCNKIDNLENKDKIYTDNKNLFISITNKLLSIIFSMQDSGVLTRKEYLSIVNITKTNLKMSSINQETPSAANLSLLDFVTKEKRKNNDFDNDKNFKPIVFDRSVYVYKLNNPNFVSLRRRKDLVNPKKMMFIKFTEDIKPPIYRQTENKLRHKISYEKIFDDLDYDEESTWEDDPDAESIDSVETEEDDSSSENNEFIETDSGEQERMKIKKPSVIFPNVKVEINYDFDPIFWELPLIPVKKISDKIKIRLENELKISKEPQNTIKRLSKRYMIVENSIRELYETLK